MDRRNFLYLMASVPLLQVCNSGTTLANAGAANTMTTLNSVVSSTYDGIAVFDELTLGVDSTHAIQTALNNPNIQAVCIAGQYEISTLIVPPTKTLFSINHHGNVQNTLLNNKMLSQRGLLVARTNKPAVILKDASKLENVFIHKKGITFVQGATCNYSGTAVEIDGADCLISKGLITGFHKAVYSVGNERVTIEGLRGDCTNGIHIKDSTDISRIRDCHFWSYGSISNANNAGCNGSFSPESHALRREGFAFYFEGFNDWTQMSGCFSYGFHFGLLIVDGSRMVVSDCGFDNINIPNFPTGSTNSNGVGVFGYTKALSLTNIVVAAMETGFYFHPNSTDCKITMSQCMIHDMRSNGIVSFNATTQHSMTNFTKVPNPTAGNVVSV